MSYLCTFNQTKKNVDMKTTIRLFSLSFILMCGLLHAQEPMTVPNGSFEQWTDHQGYSISVIGVPIPVYESFSTPDVWNYPSYPVNESLSVFGMTLNINTDIPLVRAFAESSAVPDGNSAVKLQSFMINEIINSYILSMAGDYIDNSLTEQVIPSILTTGAIDLEAFVPLITSLMSDSTDIISMIPTLLATDVNDYISGGIALGDFKPGHLTGSYKYQSATGGDNGGVILLGTHYNTTTHKREIVGGGINLALTDTSEYASFETEYVNLGDLMPDVPNEEADSLVVIIVSSASENRQQGSYLCIDNLMLWPAPPEPEEPDTCASVINLTLEDHAYDGEPQMVLTWQGSSQPDNWQIEYGPQGFELGSGTLVTTNEAFFEIYPLENTFNPNTWYEFYVRSVCNDSTYGDWASAQYLTPCASVTDLAINGDNIQVTANKLLEGYSITWNDNSDNNRWGIHYGIYTPELPDSWGTFVEVDTNYFEFPPLMPDRVYTVEVSTYCGEENHGGISIISFETLIITGIESPNPSSLISQLSIFPNPTSGIVSVKVEGLQRIDVYDICGHLVTSTTNSRVDLSGQTPGVYTLRVTTDKGTATSRIALR